MYVCMSKKKAATELRVSNIFPKYLVSGSVGKKKKNSGNYVAKLVCQHAARVNNLFKGLAII